MIARKAKQLTIFTLLLLCSTQHFAVDSVKAYENDFHTWPIPSRPYIGSKITEKPVYVTPYYVSTGVKTLHDIGIKGKGVKLGIIDSGIRVHMTAFKGNYKHYYKHVPYEDSQLKESSDCNERGISLTGIAVGKTDYFTGVAPEATLGSYRVFDCQGPTSTSLVLQALTTAVYYDKMNIIVLPEIATLDENGTKLRRAIENAAGKGVIMIVAATANNFVNQQHFSYKDLPVLSVGGARQDYRLSHWFKEKTTGRRVEFTSPCSNLEYDFDKEMDIIPNSSIGNLNEHLNGFKKGGIALVWYKKKEIDAMLQLAKSAEMTGLIIVNGISKKINKSKCDIPLFNISEDDALFIEEGYKDGRGYKYAFKGEYGYIEDGSITIDSAGPQNKPPIPPFYPDILAPSHEIYTIVLRQKRSEPYFSDVSAAVAYVAGAIALIAEADPNSSLDIVYIKTLLQNSAVPIKAINTNFYISALYQGAGMINLDRLIDTESIYVFPSSIDVGDGRVHVMEELINILSPSATPIPYKLSHIPTAAVSKSSHIIDMSSRTPVAALVSLPESINLQPKQTIKVAIKISPPTNILKGEIWSYSGYIAIYPDPKFNRSPLNPPVFISYYGTVKG